MASAFLNYTVRLDLHGRHFWHNLHRWLLTVNLYYVNKRRFSQTSATKMSCIKEFDCKLAQIFSRWFQIILQVAHNSFKYLIGHFFFKTTYLANIRGTWSTIILRFSDACGCFTLDIRMSILVCISSEILVHFLNYFSWMLGGQWLAWCDNMLEIFWSISSWTLRALVGIEHFHVVMKLNFYDRRCKNPKQFAISFLWTYNDASNMSMLFRLHSYRQDGHTNLL